MYPKEINEADVLYILDHLRPEDKHEAITLKGENYKEQVLKSILQHKDYCVMGCKKSDDTPVCIGGCIPISNDGVGCIWLLSTPDVVDYQHCLLRNIKKYLEEYDKSFWLTYNIIFVENNLAKKWLSKFGFNFNNPHPKGLNVPKDFAFFFRKRETRYLGSQSI